MIWLDNFPLPATKEGSEKGFFQLLYTVYILYSETFNKHYVGFTSNLELRLRSHNVFGRDWTAKYRPWRLIYSKDFHVKKEAMSYEIYESE